MHIIRQLADLPTAARGGAVSIGNFDGVHRGHAAIVRQLLERAEEVGGPAVVFTFDPHPVRLLRPDQCPPPLTWTERKAELLAALGVDWVVAYPTDEALLNLSAQEFFDRIVRGALAARAVVEGPEFLLRPQSRRHDRSPPRVDDRRRHHARHRPARRNRRRDCLQLPRASAHRRRPRRRSGQAARRALPNSRHGHPRRRPRRKNRLPHRQFSRHRYAACRPKASTPAAPGPRAKVGPPP